MQNSKHGISNKNSNKNLYFKWFQLVRAISNHWKKTLVENTISYLNHSLLKHYQIHSAENPTAKEVYLISLQHKTAKPTSQKYFESMFRDLTLQWKHIYNLPRITTIDSKLRCFQYKFSLNTLYLNQKLFLFRKHSTLCSFCHLGDEMVIHLFEIVLKLNEYGVQ